MLRLLNKQHTVRIMGALWGKKKGPTQQNSCKLFQEKTVIFLYLNPAYGLSLAIDEAGGIFCLGNLFL